MMPTLTDKESSRTNSVDAAKDRTKSPFGRIFNFINQHLIQRIILIILLIVAYIFYHHLMEDFIEFDFLEKYTFIFAPSLIILAIIFLAVELMIYWRNKLIDKKPLKERIFYNSLIPDSELKPNGNPFLNNCFAGLENFAKNLQIVIENRLSDEGFVVFLEAPYGFGKTTFINMLGQKLVNKKNYAVKFNAWQDDYHEDPIIGITSQFISQLKFYPNLKKHEAVFQNIFNELNQLISELEPPWYIRLIYRLQNLSKENYSKKDRIKKLKTQLASIVSKEEIKNFYFFIDELDRCKPTYAIKTLEIIKHLFNIKGFCFIVSINTEALLSCLRKEYGSKFPAEHYLKRFADMQFTLPTTLNKKPGWGKQLVEQHIPEAKKKWLPSKIEKSKKSKIAPYFEEKTKKYIEANIRYFDLDPREAKKYIDDYVLFVILAIEREASIPRQYIIPITILIASARKSLGHFSKIVNEISENGDIKRLFPNFHEEKSKPAYPNIQLFDNIEICELKDISKFECNFLNDSKPLTENILFYYKKNNIKYFLCFYTHVMKAILLFDPEIFRPQSMQSATETFYSEEKIGFEAFEIAYIIDKKPVPFQISNANLTDLKRLENPRFKIDQIQIELDKMPLDDAKTEKMKFQLEKVFPAYLAKKGQQETFVLQQTFKLLLASKTERQLVNAKKSQGFNEKENYFYKETNEDIFNKLISEYGALKDARLEKYYNHFSEILNILRFLDEA